MTGWNASAHLDLSLDGAPFLRLTESGTWKWTQPAIAGVHIWTAVLPGEIATGGSVDCNAPEVVVATSAPAPITTVVVTARPVPTPTTTTAPVVTSAPDTTTTVLDVTAEVVATEPVVTASSARLPDTGATTGPALVGASSALALGLALVLAALRKRIA
jgi:hypothetical protein